MEPEHDRHDDREDREPFWAAFRRRCPDVDVVLLPAPRPAPPADAGGPTGEPRYDEPAVVAAAADGAERLADELWDACAAGAVGDRDDPPPRWTHGPRKGVVRREVSRVLVDADPVAAALAVDRGATLLRETGWAVTEPSDGVPRVVASRGEGSRREEALVLVALDSGRIVVRYRSGGLVVPRAAARRLVAGGAA